MYKDKYESMEYIVKDKKYEEYYDKVMSKRYFDDWCEKEKYDFENEYQNVPSKMTCDKCSQYSEQKSSCNHERKEFKRFNFEREKENDTYETCSLPKVDISLPLVEKERVVKCLNNTGYEDKFQIGVEYLLVEVRDDLILVEDMLGQTQILLKERFEIED